MKDLIPMPPTLPTHRNQLLIWKLHSQLHTKLILALEYTKDCWKIRRLGRIPYIICTFLWTSITHEYRALEFPETNAGNKCSGNNLPKVWTFYYIFNFVLCNHVSPLSLLVITTLFVSYPYQQIPLFINWVLYTVTVHSMQKCFSYCWSAAAMVY